MHDRQNTDDRKQQTKQNTHRQLSSITSSNFFPVKTSSSLKPLPSLSPQHPTYTPTTSQLVNSLCSTASNLRKRSLESRTYGKTATTSISGTAISSPSRLPPPPLSSTLTATTGSHVLLAGSLDPGQHHLAKDCCHHRLLLTASARLQRVQR